MVRVLTTKAFRFTNPNSGSGVSKPKPNETAEEAIQRVARDAARGLSNASNVAKHKEHFCDVQPGTPVDCPDWIKLDEIFAWGVSDGDIMELVPAAKSATKAQTAAAALGETSVEDDEEEDKNEEDEKEEADDEITDEPEVKDEDGNLGGAALPPVEGGPAIRRRVVGKRRRNS